MNSDIFVLFIIAKGFLQPDLFTTVTGQNEERVKGKKVDGAFLSGARIF
jgi:hypothetical protein